MAEITEILSMFKIGHLVMAAWQAIKDWIHRTGRHNLMDGTSQEGDICLQKYSFKEDHNKLRKIEKTYRYPAHGEPEKETIHGIFCYDHRNDDRGGKVYIKSGGVGAKYVEIYFESMVARGIEYTITIVGQ